MSPPLTEPQKRYLRKVKQIKQPHSLASTLDKPEEVKRERDFIAPYTIKFGRRTKRGFNGCKLDPAIRAIVERKRALNAAFHRDLAAFVRGA